MKKEIAIDELALIESNTQLKVLDIDQFKTRVLEGCWLSLRSTKEKQMKFRSQEVKLNGYFVEVGGVDDAICVYNPNGSLSVFDAINEIVSKFSASLKIATSYQSQEATSNNGLVCSFSHEQWSGIPIDIAQEMLEEIELKLRTSAFSVAYFKDFDKSSELLRSYAYTLIEQPNVVVILESSLDLSSSTPPIPAFSDHALLSRSSIFILQPTRKDMDEYSNLCHKEEA